MSNSIDRSSPDNSLQRTAGSVKSMRKHLLVTGSLLMLIGLVHGFVPDITPNRSLGVSAHVAAIQNGTILVVLGIAWRYTSLGKFDRWGAWINIIGMYGLWTGLFLAAAMGLRSPNASVLTSNIQFSASILVVLGIAIALYGFVRHHAV